MTKPFEMMGREQFLKEVVSSVLSPILGSTLGMDKCSIPLSLSRVVFWPARLADEIGSSVK